MVGISVGIPPTSGKELEQLHTVHNHFPRAGLYRSVEIDRCEPEGTTNSFTCSGVLVISRVYLISEATDGNSLTSQERQDEEIPEILDYFRMAESRLPDRFPSQEIPRRLPLRKVQPKNPFIRADGALYQAQNGDRHKICKNSVLGFFIDPHDKVTEGGS